MADSLKTVRERFIEQIGLVAQGEALPRIAGRLMGLMVFDGRPYSFSELAKELKVSRGSISSNARLLEERGVIERVTSPGDRQDYYQLTDNPYETLLRKIAQRARKAESLIAKTAAALPQSEKKTLARIERYRNFYEIIAANIDHAATKLN